MLNNGTHQAKRGRSRWLTAAGAIAAVMVTGGAALAHDGHDNEVAITVQGDQRCIVSNGLPDHDTGQFPNQGNPNTISEQNIQLCVDATPTKTGQATELRGVTGVAVNGIEIRPGTAEWYDASSPRGVSRDRSSGWNYEGFGNAAMLGIDGNHAHVDNTGLYHYHAVLDGLTDAAEGTQIGYAPDGFEIHYVGGQQSSSYQLKPGTRPSGPGGAYDGTFVQDWEYVAGSGTLDQCNGGTLNGEFVYFATDSYPFFPRCAWGEVSADFQRGGGGPAIAQGQDPAGQAGQLGGPLQGRQAQGQGPQQFPQTARAQGPRQGPGFGPPAEAVNACAGSGEGSSCAFTSPRGDAISGTCGPTQNGATACIPEGGPPRL
jgi:hypothetical protein